MTYQHVSNAHGETFEVPLILPLGVRSARVHIAIAWDMVFPDPPSTTDSQQQIIDVPKKDFYTVAEVEALLGDVGRLAMEQETAAFRAELAEQLRTGELTRLGYHRKMRGITQGELAEAAGTRQPYLSRIEAGRQNLSRPMAKKLALVLQIKVSELTGDE